MWIEHNENPMGKRVGDCVMRAISKATGKRWGEVFCGIVAEGFSSCDIPSSNAVWGSYLRKKGWVRRPLRDGCPECFTVREFCEENPKGTYILALSGHVVCVIDGDYYDTFDSGDGNPIYFWERTDKR